MASSFSERLPSNPIINDVLAYVQRSGREYAISISDRGIGLHGLGAFQGTREDSSYDYEIKERTPQFSFYAYGFKNLTKTQQYDVASYLLSKLRYRNKMSIRPWYLHYSYSNREDNWKFVRANSSSSINIGNLMQFALGDRPNRAEFLFYAIDAVSPVRSKSNTAKLNNW